jgi:hypothetical protein
MRKYGIEIRDGKPYHVVKLPSDWRLQPRAVRERTLWQAATPQAQKEEIARKRKAKWKRRQKKKR